MVREINYEICFDNTFIYTIYVYISLPETGDLPSAEALPSVFYRALGKDRVCRVPNKIHSANKNTRQNTSLPSVFFLALGKDVFCRVLFFGTRQNTSLPSVFFWHSAKMYFAECLCFGTRQRSFLPCAFFLPSANHFFEAIFEALNEFK